MVRAWYLQEDCCENKSAVCDDSLTMDEVHFNSGVEYMKIDDIEGEKVLDKLREEKSLSHEDLLEVFPDDPEYDEKVKAFFQEHMHPDEEVRLFRSGEGYFDVRDRNDEWIRIHVGKGDLLILPVGIYHRFFPRKNNQVLRIGRFFTEITAWEHFKRPADDHPARKEYLHFAANGFGIHLQRHATQ